MKHISEKKLSAYLDGELNEKQRQEIKVHLETCEYCQGLVAEFKMVSQSLENLEGLDPSSFFTSWIKGKVLESTQIRGWRRVMVPALASTAAALSIVAGGFIGQIMYAGTTEIEVTSETELTGYLGTSPAQDYPDGSFGEIIDEVFGENGGNS